MFLMWLLLRRLKKQYRYNQFPIQSIRSGCQKNQLKNLMKFPEFSLFNPGFDSMIGDNDSSEITCDTLCRAHGFDSLLNQIADYQEEQMMLFFTEDSYSLWSLFYYVHHSLLHSLYSTMENSIVLYTWWSKSYDSFLSFLWFFCFSCLNLYHESCSSFFLQIKSKVKWSLYSNQSTLSSRIHYSSNCNWIEVVKVFGEILLLWCASLSCSIYSLEECVWCK